MAAELPTLAGAATVSGASTSAVFRAGASTDGAVFRNDFLPSQSLSLAAQIDVEAGHVGQTGNLFVLVALDQQFFMRDTSGNFQPWDLNPDSLQATVVNTPLAASTELQILEDAALAASGLQGASFSLYLAYNLNSAPQQLYYSASPLQVAVASYDPLQVATYDPQSFTTTMLDSNRNREIPLLIFLPETTAAAPVVMFSHGLGGTYETAVYLGEHWAARGYVVVFMQHAGSDGAILDGVAPADILALMQAAASLENHLARIGDVSAVIDQLESWNGDTTHTLHQRLDLANLGMAGHSFGARTTQTTSGEIVPWLNYSTTDPRIKAALPLSASVTNIDTAEEMLAPVAIPWMVMTGTLDESLINDTTVADRLAVFPALPPGAKYELVLFDGEHHAFTDRPISAFQNPRNPAHHPAIMALSTAFWDSFLRGDTSARQWLESEAARAVLAPADSWQWK